MLKTLKEFIYEDFLHHFVYRRRSTADKTGDESAAGLWIILDEANTARRTDPVGLRVQVSPRCRRFHGSLNIYLGLDSDKRICRFLIYSFDIIHFYEFAVPTVLNWNPRINLH